MQYDLAVRLLAVVFAIAACAPPIDGPAERARVADRDDSAALAAELAALPGATSAHVVLHRPARDPFTLATSPASAAVLVIVDDRANVAEIEATTRRLVRAAAPEITSPVVAVMVGVHRPDVARVGPFTVEAGSKHLLQAVLVGALALVAALASYVALRARQ